jgi:hypothetical protein
VLSILIKIWACLASLLPNASSFFPTHIMNCFVGRVLLVLRIWEFPVPNLGSETAILTAVFRGILTYFRLSSQVSRGSPRHFCVNSRIAHKISQRAIYSVSFPILYPLIILSLHEVQSKLLTHSLTYGTEPFLRSCQLCRYSTTSQHFMEPEGSLPCSQELSTGPYSDPDQSSPYHPILSL